MRRRFRWTRETYRQAARLARISPIFGAYGRDNEAPVLLQRYWELNERYPQHEDPLACEHWQLMNYLRSKHCGDDIPF